MPASACATATVTAGNGDISCSLRPRVRACIDSQCISRTGQNATSFHGRRRHPEDFPSSSPSVSVTDLQSVPGWQLECGAGIPLLPVVGSRCCELLHDEPPYSPVPDSAATGSSLSAPWNDITSSTHSMDLSSAFDKESHALIPLHPSILPGPKPTCEGTPNAPAIPTVSLHSTNLARALHSSPDGLASNDAKPEVQATPPLPVPAPCAGAKPRQRRDRNYGRPGKYRGVRYRGKGRWSAEIKVREARRWLGIFQSAEEAARAFDKAAFEIRGSRATLNFSVAGPQQQQQVMKDEQQQHSNSKVTTATASSAIPRLPTLHEENATVNMVAVAADLVPDRSPAVVVSATVTTIVTASQASSEENRGSRRLRRSRSRSRSRSSSIEMKCEETCVASEGDGNQCSEEDARQHCDKSMTLRSPCGDAASAITGTGLMPRTPGKSDKKQQQWRRQPGSTLQHQDSLHVWEDEWRYCSTWHTHNCPPCTPLQNLMQHSYSNYHSLPLTLRQGRARMARRHLATQARVDAASPACTAGADGKSGCPRASQPAKRVCQRQPSPPSPLAGAAQVSTSSLQPVPARSHARSPARSAATVPGSLVPSSPPSPSAGRPSASPHACARPHAPLPHALPASALASTVPPPPLAAVLPCSSCVVDTSNSKAVTHETNTAFTALCGSRPALPLPRTASLDSVAPAISHPLMDSDAADLGVFYEYGPHAVHLASTSLSCADDDAPTATVTLAYASILSTSGEGRGEPAPRAPAEEKSSSSSFYELQSSLWEFSGYLESGNWDALAEISELLNDPEPPSAPSATAAAAAAAAASDNEHNNSKRVKSCQVLALEDVSSLPSVVHAPFPNDSEFAGSQQAVSRSKAFDDCLCAIEHGEGMPCRATVWCPQSWCKTASLPLSASLRK